MRFSHIVRRLLVIAVSLGFLGYIGINHTATATTVNNVSPEAKVTFTFDDGLKSSLTHAAPILAKYGLTATEYVITGCVGSSGMCAANESADYMTWDQISQLVRQYKWRIGSHTVTHPHLSELSAREQQTELAASKAALAKHGITATGFSAPYGDYNRKTLELAAKYYESIRGFWDIGYNRWPYNENLLAVQQVQSGVSVAQVKDYIDNAITKKQWLILVFHDIKDTPSSDPEDFEYAANDLNQIAAYVKQRNIPSPDINKSVIKSNVNLLPNSSFNEGLARGWTTDTPDKVKPDSNNNGNYPGPQNAIALASGNSSAHLFSPKITVDSQTTYMIKSYLNVLTIASGQVGYYIDEYDVRGRWVSGQWKSSESSAFAEHINFTYRSSSSAVKQAQLQIYLTPGSGALAYVDNFQWFPIKQ